MRRNVLISLVVCNAIWSVNPIAAKILLERLPPAEVAWLRCGSTLLTVMLLQRILHWLRPAEVSSWSNSLRRTNLRWIASLGLISFFGSVLLHTEGLSGTTATANALIIAMEPLIAALLAWMVLNEKLGSGEGGAFALAIAGFFLLSRLRPEALWSGGEALNLGNLILLLSTVTDSTFSVVSRRLVGKVAPVSILAHALPFGFVPLTLYAAAKGIGFLSPLSLTPKEWLALLWFGPLGTGLTWAYWSVVLRNTTVAAASLTLFAQPILGAVAGFAFLGERLTFWQSIGALLILTALCFQTHITLRRNHEPKPRVH